MTEASHVRVRATLKPRNETSKQVQKERENCKVGYVHWSFVIGSFVIGSSTRRIVVIIESLHARDDLQAIV